MAQDIKQKIKYAYWSEYKKKYVTPISKFLGSKAGVGLQLLAGTMMLGGLLSLFAKVNPTVFTSAGSISLQGVAFVVAYALSIAVLAVSVQVSNNRDYATEDAIRADIENGTLVKRYAEEFIPQQEEKNAKLEAAVAEKVKVQSAQLEAEANVRRAEINVGKTVLAGDKAAALALLSAKGQFQTAAAPVVTPAAPVTSTPSAPTA